MVDIGVVGDAWLLLSELHKRMDADKDLYYLTPYTMKDLHNKTLPGIINVTLNLPAVFAAHVNSALMGAAQQVKVTSLNMEDKETAKVEEFIRAALRDADELLLRRGEAALRPFVTEQVDIRGRTAARVTGRLQDGVWAPLVMPVDTRYFTHEMGAERLRWAAYSTWRSPAAIRQEYPGGDFERLGLQDRRGVGDGGGAFGAGGGVQAVAAREVIDFWDEESNRVYVGGEVAEPGTVSTLEGAVPYLSERQLLFQQENPYGYVPFCVQTVPLGSMLRDADNLKRRGESIFFLMRDLVPELNRLASLMQTSNTSAVLAALQYASKQGSEATPPKDPGALATVTSVDIGGGLELVPTGDIKAAGRLMHSMLTRMVQAGSQSMTDYGNAQFPLSAVALVQLGESSDQVFLPRLGAKGLLFQQIAAMLIDQVLATGQRTFKMGTRGHRRTFVASELRGAYDIEFRYTPKAPQLDVARWSLAEAAMGFLDMDTILEDVLHVDDPAAIRDHKRMEDAENLSPMLKLYRTAKALIARGEEMEARIIAEEIGLTLEQVVSGNLEPKPPSLNGRNGREPARNIPVFGSRAGSNTRATELMGEPQAGSPGEEV